MEALILDANQTLLAVIDTYKSFIWTERYRECGEFQLIVPISIETVKLIRSAFYISIQESKKLMVIETLETSSDSEEGEYFIISGRSLESVLDRRIVWEKQTFSSTTLFWSMINSIIQSNVINPKKSTRKIPGVVFKTITDPRISIKKLSDVYGATSDLQIYGDNVYDLLCTLCENFDVGFKMDPDENGVFQFELYLGEDRSYNQLKNPWVVFSPSYNNLLSSSYLKSNKIVKNVILASTDVTTTVAKPYPNQSEYTSKVYTYTAEVTSESEMPSGLNRREMFEEPSISGTDDSGNALTSSSYEKILKAEGKKILKENAVSSIFEGELNSRVQFIYGKDFFLGDVVQVSNKYGFETRCRIDEIIWSNDENGYVVTPSFSLLDE